MDENEVIQDIVETLEEIQDNMLGLVSDAECAIRDAPSSVRERAKAYWLAQMKIALSNEHGYLASSGCSLEDTLDSLRESGD